MEFLLLTVILAAFLGFKLRRRYRILLWIEQCHYNELNGYEMSADAHLCFDLEGCALHGCGCIYCMEYRKQHHLYAPENHKGWTWLIRPRKGLKNES